MSLVRTESPVSVTPAKTHTPTVGHLVASNDFQWSVTRPLWRPAREPWLRRELLILWTFLIVLAAISYFIIHLLSQMQSNVSAQTRSTSKLTEQVAAVAATQDAQKARIAQVQHSYSQVLGTVGELGHSVSELNSTDRQLLSDLQTLAARVKFLEHQQQVVRVVSPAPTAVAVPRAMPVAPSDATKQPQTNQPSSVSVAQAKASALWTQPTGAGHVHQFLRDVTPPKAAEVKQIGGEDSVWVLNKNGTPMVVRPFSVSSLGTWVHCANDNRDYILTPSGGWMAGSVQP